jgi:hypothetical protein
MFFVNQDAMSLSVPVLQMSILSLGVIANILLILAHWKDPLRVFKNTTSLFVRNIAVIDIAVAILWIIRIALTLLGKKHETISLIWLAFTTMSPFAFLCFAIERFLSVAFPLWYRVRGTIQICRKVLCGKWIAHTAIFVLTYFILNKKDRRKFMLWYVIVLFLAVNIFYLATYVALRRQRNALRNRQDISEGSLTAMQKARQKQEKRFLVTIAIVCFILTIVYVPLLGMATITVLLRDVLNVKRTEEVFSVLFVLLSVNFLINPIIYLLRLPKYRKTFKELYCNFI